MTTPAAPASDQDLLLRHAQEGSGDAFEELACRHMDLVYSAALRQVSGDHCEAADVVQEVFLELARKAARVARHPAPVGWLYTTTRRMALRRIRTRRQREFQEQTAHAMHAMGADGGETADWERLGPVLDEALHELRESDRLAILWRYFERRSFPELGARLGLGENGARMRVARALEKLRTRLRRRGITSSASAVAMALEGAAVTAAPAGLAGLAQIAGSLASPAALAGSSSILIILMNSTTAKMGVGILVAALLGISLWIQNDRLRKLRLDNDALRQQLAETESQRNAVEARWRERASADNAGQRLQQEVLKLRGELARLRRDSASPAARTPPSSTAAAPRPLPAPVRATLPPGHSLVTGGWDWTDGRRAVLISTPTHKVGDDGQVHVHVQSRVLLMTEPVMDELGFKSLGVESPGVSEHRELSASERSDLFARVENHPGIEVMGNPGFSTTSGTGGSVGMSSDDLPDVVVVGIVPTVTADGQVDLELDFRKEPLPAGAGNPP